MPEALLRVLAPACLRLCGQRVSEVIFGLLMAMTFIGPVNVMTAGCGGG